MKKQKLFVLPYASTSMVSGPLLCTDGSDLLLSMDFDDNGETRPACLKFVKQRAFRKRAENYCTGWHVVDVFDTVCEVHESDWVSELRAASAPEWRDRWIMRHFMIYVDNFGCVEVIAESVSLGKLDIKNSGGT